MRKKGMRTSGQNIPPQRGYDKILSSHYQQYDIGYQLTQPNVQSQLMNSSLGAGVSKE
jgi:hypothetical protein